MVKEYTQVVQPVKRTAEKIFGWLGWLALLAITILVAYGSFVAGNDPQVLSQIEQSAEEAAMESGASANEISDIAISMVQNAWLLSLLLLIPLIISFIGLIKMKSRILSGVLLLITAILIAPLVITLFSSLMFVIAAVLLFVRKDTVITESDYFRTHSDRVRQDYGNNDKSEREEYDKEDNYKKGVRMNNNYDDNISDEDLEETREFTAIDENLDTQEIDYPVTDEEYDTKAGYDIEDDGYTEDVDAKRTRRENLNRRNRE